MLEALTDAEVAVGNYFTATMTAAAPRLKLLHAVGAGVDTFALDKLSPKTTVSNVYFHGPAIGEYVLMMMLALSRDLLRLDTRFRKGDWEGSWIWGEPPPAELAGKSLGLVGFGHLGKEVAARARAFGMKIRLLSAHPPARKPGWVDFWGQPKDLRRLLVSSDFVVVACPLNDQTRGWIGAREIGWMKPTAYLINVARGPIVAEEALYNALREKKIAGAAVDVWYQYPADGGPTSPSRFPFQELDNLIMTPHVAGWMRGTREQRFRLIAENIGRLVQGRPLLNVLQGPKKHARD
jgi:phosphoglycerate dehydrogenase-like enzyme